MPPVCASRGSPPSRCPISSLRASMVSQKSSVTPAKEPWICSTQTYYSATRSGGTECAGIACTRALHTLARSTYHTLARKTYRSELLEEKRKDVPKRTEDRRELCQLARSLLKCVYSCPSGSRSHLTPHPSPRTPHLSPLAPRPSGGTECAGNAWESCVQDLYPESTLFLPVIDCIEGMTCSEGEKPPMPGSYEQVPILMQQTTKIHATRNVSTPSAGVTSNKPETLNSKPSTQIPLH